MKEITIRPVRGRRDETYFGLCTIYPEKSRIRIKINGLEFC